MWVGKVINVFIKFYLILKKVDTRDRNLITISDLTESGILKEYNKF